MKPAQERNTRAGSHPIPLWEERACCRRGIPQRYVERHEECAAFVSVLRTASIRTVTSCVATDGCRAATVATSECNL